MELETRGLGLILDSEALARRHVVNSQGYKRVGKSGVAAAPKGRISYLAAWELNLCFL